MQSSISITSQEFCKLLGIKSYSHWIITAKKALQRAGQVFTLYLRRTGKPGRPSRMFDVDAEIATSFLKQRYPNNTKLIEGVLSKGFQPLATKVEKVIKRVKPTNPTVFPYDMFDVEHPDEYKKGAPYECTESEKKNANSNQYIARLIVQEVWEWVTTGKIPGYGFPLSTLAPLYKFHVGRQYMETVDDGLLSDIHQAYYALHAGGYYKNFTPPLRTIPAHIAHLFV